MQPACTAIHPLLPEGATALEIPSDRPAFTKSFKRLGVFPAATAVRLDTSPSERRARRPESATVYVKLSAPDPKMEDDTQRTAYAYITPDTSPRRAEPGPFIRLVFRTLALDLPQTFEILSPLFAADAAVRFRTHAQREVALHRQPFELDGATVELVPLRLINISHTANLCYMVHVALHKYPIEQRTPRDIADNCRGFGCVQEIGVTAPDLSTSTVCAILQLEDPRAIPYELHIEYFNGFTSVVPIEILSVWECSESFDANGDYVYTFLPPEARTPWLDGWRGSQLAEWMMWMEAWSLDDVDGHLERDDACLASLV